MYPCHRLGKDGGDDCQFSRLLFWFFFCLRLCVCVAVLDPAALCCCCCLLTAVFRTVRFRTEGPHKLLAAQMRNDTTSSPEPPPPPPYHPLSCVFPAPRGVLPLSQKMVVQGCCHCCHGSGVSLFFLSFFIIFFFFCCLPPSTYWTLVLCHPQIH